MPVRWATTSGNWSNLAIWNDSASLGFPTASDDIWANNNNINIDQSFSVISLNSTARARDIATPAMTSDSTPSPYVAAASSIAGAGFEAYRAFDRNYTAASNAWSTTTALPQWLSMDFGSGSSIVIDGYTVYGRSAQNLNIREWTLEGSNNNTSWVILHTVTSATAIPANGTYSVSSIGNTTGYRYYRLNISANGGLATGLTELELYQRFTAALAAGGSFIFNSGSISGSATSTTAALSQGAANTILVTATTGSVTLNVSSSVAVGAISNIINHTGNCDFNLNGQNFTGGSTGIVCISKSSAGTITIRGNLLATSAQNSHAFSSTNGNTIVIGNVTAIGGSGIVQSVGNLTVTGNVTGGTGFNNPGISLTGAASQFTIIGNVTGGTSTNAFGISHSGTSGSVIGNVTGGSGTTAHGINTVGAVTVTGTVTGGAGSLAHGINTTTTITVTGNVLGNAGNGVNANTGTVTIIGNITGGATVSGLGLGSANNANITGTVTAGTQTGVNSTGGTVNLTGNMINVSGRQAIFAQNLFISNAATSQWRLFTQGGQDKTLYSADTFPNQPSAANVRSGSLYGPANALSGSMVVPVPSNVRVGVLTDNTVGTGQSLTAADFLAAISASADPFAERLRNVATVDTVGSLVTGLNGGF